MLTRRMFAKRSLSAFACGWIASLKTTNAYSGEETKSDKDEIAMWMADWMGRKSVSGPLHVSRFADPVYFLTRPISWKPNSDQEGKYEQVIVPTGFVTDFASVPRIFWSLLRPDGLYTYPAILHDFLYWTQDRPIKAANDILKLGMEEFGVSTTVVTAIYEAVNRFGSTAWNENQRLKAAGEKRILRQFPDDPLITWDNWKRRPEVFLP